MHSYESEFRLKEAEFRPRKKFKHRRVINELALIVKEADNELAEFDEALSDSIKEIKSLRLQKDALLLRVKKEKARYERKLTVSLFTGASIGALLCSLVFLTL